MNDKPTEEITEAKKLHIRKQIQLLIDNQCLEQAIILSQKWNIPLDVKQIGLEIEETEHWLKQFITQNPAMLQLKEYVRILAKIQDAVLICGASGTGKEILARALHGNRPKERFIAINAAGLPEHLIESELFGHTKGAFTGATVDKAGLFKVASDGTLFLDEVGDLQLPLQAKLLRAIQEHKIRKVGSTEEENINCRVIAASHYNLPELIKQNRFRLDLYARLSTFELYTSPLSERPEDIPLIISSLDRDNKCKELKIDPNNLELNVRSLQRIVRRKLILDIEP